MAPSTRHSRRLCRGCFPTRARASVFPRQAIRTRPLDLTSPAPLPELLQMKKKAARALARPYLFHKGCGVRLKDIGPGDTSDLYRDSDAARAALADGIARLRTLQEKLYAQD